MGKTTLLRHMAAYDIEGFPRHHRVMHVRQEIKASEKTVIQVCLLVCLFGRGGEGGAVVGFSCFFLSGVVGCSRGGLVARGGYEGRGGGGLWLGRMVLK